MAEGIMLGREVIVYRERADGGVRPPFPMPRERA